MMKAFNWNFVTGAVIAGVLGMSLANSAEAADIRVMVYNGAYTSITVHVAKDLGFYEKNGLNAELVTVASGPAGVAALLGGSLDFAEPPTDQVILNVLQGTDLKVVVGNEVKNFYKIIVRDKNEFPNAHKGYPDLVQDLKGKTIGVNALGSTTHLVMNAILMDAGLKPDDVTYLAVGSAATALAAWDAGRVDVQVAFTPFPEIVAELGTGEPLLDLSTGDGPSALTTMGGAFEGFITTGKFIEENRETVDAFIQAHIEAINWIKDPANRERLIELVNQHVAVSVIPEAQRNPTIERMIDNYTGFLGYTVDPAAIEGWNQYLAASGLASRAVTAEEVIYSGAPKP